MGITVTPNMSLPVPNPAGSASPEPGPQYAVDNNESFGILDSHNHSPGSGVQITPAGLNINTSLSFQNNQATNVYGVQFSAPSASSLLTFLYTAPQSGGGIYDLFYNDGAGNVVALTKAGLVNATIASIPGESYSGGTFTWKQGAGSTTPANFDIGSVTIRPNVAATTNGVVLGPPSGISSQYNVQLPIVPGSATSIMQLDTSGNMLATLVPDNSSIVISSQILQVGAKGITQGMLANRTSGSTVGAGGVAVSASSGSFSTTGGSTPITNLSVTITTTGRPVFVSLGSDNAGDSYIGASVTVSSGAGDYVVGARINFLNGGISIAQQLVENETYILNTGTLTALSPSSSFSALDLTVNGSPGTYTYTVDLANAGSGTSFCNDAILIAYEI